ncbi:Carboxymuconolactone decarboxylase family protein [Stieleria maiorica]|uniref:Carboxymuconolactone decarboxylase family protein n=1 Tax=Stieleria maiorica TaxID=2795974 RepID=A0A5B9MG03_9BACT|nr:carboxymuconolactone decarboxylase family protein [Stieleria maiorica]QEF98950.1 Carboxymuconolactone decarboxylase family protein [Stieleria maiorica]
MARINPINPAEATGTAKELLGGVQSKLGMIPNMMSTMAHAPAVLDAYLKFSGALASGDLSTKQREQIALAVGQANRCDYCLSAHTAIGKMVGLSADQIRDARLATAADAKSDAVLKLATQLVEARGLVSDNQVAAARRAGLTGGEIAEVVANTALNLLTNYFNHVAETEIDFPPAEPLESSATCGCHSDSCSVA